MQRRLLLLLLILAIIVLTSCSAKNERVEQIYVLEAEKSKLNLLIMKPAQGL